MKIDQDSKVPKIQYSSAGVTSVEVGGYDVFSIHYTLFCILNTLYTTHYTLLLAIYSQDENGRLAICN